MPVVPIAAMLSHLIHAVILSAAGICECHLSACTMYSSARPRPATKITPLKTSPATSFLPRTGILLSVDNYYNLQLADTEEWIDGAMAGNLGEVLIR